MGRLRQEARKEVHCFVGVVSLRLRAGVTGLHTHWWSMESDIQICFILLLCDEL